MAAQIQINFDALPDNDRKRLVQALGNPASKIHEEAPSNLRFYSGRVFLVLLPLLFLYPLIFRDLGNPSVDTVWTSYDNIVWYAICLLVIVYAIVSSWVRFKLKKLFGFVPGRYLLPSVLIDARASLLKLYDLAALTGLEATHHLSNGSYSKTVFRLAFADGSAQTFTISNKNKAEHVLRRFDELRGAMREALDTQNMAALQGFDPFLTLRKNGWAPSAGQAGNASAGAFLRLLKHPVTMSVLLTALIAPAIWAVRNAAADQEMYKQAKRIKTEEAYLAYLWAGKFHVDEMRAALPRVAFDEIVRKKSVTALRDLLARYPKGNLQQPVAAEIHALYQKSFVRFRDQAAQSDPVLVAAMEKLLDIVEKRADPNVPIQFVRPTLDELTRLDATLKQRGSPTGVGTIIPAAAHFSESSAAGREARIVAGLKSAFQTIFPNDVLALTPGGTGDGRLPRLKIVYQIDPSGNLYRAEKSPDRGFVGLVVRFQSALVVSETDEQWRFNLEVEPPDTFRVDYKTAAGSVNVGPEDSQVYAVMAERAFDKLASKILAAFFKPDSQAVIRQIKAEDLKKR